MILVCLKVFGFNFSTLPIKSFSILFILLSSWPSLQFFTPSRLSRASDTVNVFFFRLVRLLCHLIHWLMIQHLPSEWLLQCFFHEILVSNLLLSINSWLWRYSLKVKVYILVNCSFIRTLHKQFLELSVNLFIYNWGISNVKITFFKAVLNGFWDYTLPCGLKTVCVVSSFSVRVLPWLFEKMFFLHRSN